MSDIYGDIAALKTKADALSAQKVARFAYTQVAYDGDEVAGVTDYDFTRDQNVPNKDTTDFNSVVLDKGVRTQAASIPRMGINHFFGRTSYNLNKMSDWFPAFLASNLRSEAQNAHLYSPTAAYKQYDLCFTIDSVSLMRKTYMRISSSPGDLVGSAPPNATHWKQLEGQTGTGYLPYVDANGRMGIGRAPTTYTLEVGGDIYATGSLRSAGLTSGSVLFSGSSGDVSQNNAQLFWDSTNNRLGIGTTSPYAKLDVKGNVYAENAVGSGLNVSTLVLSSGGGSSGLRSGISFYSTFTANADTNPRRSADIWSGYSTGVWGTEYIAFGVGGASDTANLTSEKMRITAGGNVLIGATTPTAHLQVENASDLQLQVTGKGTGWSGSKLVDIYSEYTGSSTNSLLLRVGNATYPNTLIINQAGQVGIGVTPYAGLTAYAGMTNYDPSATFGVNASFAFQASNNEIAMGVATATPYAFWLQSRQLTVGAWALALNPSGGNVGINTLSPISSLQVGGIITAGGTPTNGQVMLQDYVGSSRHIGIIGSEQSSGGLFFGYGVRPGSPSPAFISTYDSAIARAALTVTGSFPLRAYAGATQSPGIDALASLSVVFSVDNSGSISASGGNVLIKPYTAGVMNNLIIPAGGGIYVPAGTYFVSVYAGASSGGANLYINNTTSGRTALHQAAAGTSTPWTLLFSNGNNFYAASGASGSSTLMCIPMQ